MTGEIKTFMSCKPLSDAKSFVSTSKLFPPDIATEISVEFFSRDDFSFFAGVFRVQLLCIRVSVRDRIKQFGRKRSEGLLHLREDDWKVLRVETFCVFVVRRLVDLK